MFVTLYTYSYMQCLVCKQLKAAAMSDGYGMSIHHMLSETVPLLVSTMLLFYGLKLTKLL